MQASQQNQKAGFAIQESKRNMQLRRVRTGERGQVSVHDDLPVLRGQGGAQRGAQQGGGSAGAGGLCGGDCGSAAGALLHLLHVQLLHSFLRLLHLGRGIRPRRPCRIEDRFNNGALTYRNVLPRAAAPRSPVTTARFSERSPRGERGREPLPFLLAEEKKLKTGEKMVPSRVVRGGLVTALPGSSSLPLGFARLLLSWFVVSWGSGRERKKGVDILVTYSSTAFQGSAMEMITCTQFRG